MTILRRVPTAVVGGAVAVLLVAGPAAGPGADQPAAATPAPGGMIDFSSV